MVLGQVLMLSIMAMLAAHGWFWSRLVTRKPVLPPRAAGVRLVPFGWGSMLLLLVLFVGMIMSVRAEYEVGRRLIYGPRPPAPAPVETPKDDPGKKAKPSDLSFQEQMALMAVINVLMVVLVPLLLRWTSRTQLADLGLTTDQLSRNVVTGGVAFLLITPVVMAVNLGATLLFPQNKHPVELMLRQHLSAPTVVLAYVAAMIVAPVAEELLFRGVFQAWLRRVFAYRPPRIERDVAQAPCPESLPAEVEILEGWSTDGDEISTEVDAIPSDLSNPYHAPEASLATPERPVPLPREPRSTRPAMMAVTSASFLFALLHFEQMPAPFAIFALSLALGFLYEWTGSLVPSVVVHALFNGFNTTLLMLALASAPAEHASIPTGVRDNKPVSNRAMSRAFQLAHEGSAVRVSRDRPNRATSPD